MSEYKNKKLTHRSSSNNCSNSHHGVSKKRMILATVQKSEIELTPMEIAQKAMVNASTTRNYLRQLLKEGKVVQPYPGAYCTKIIHGMMFAPLRIHNLILSVSAPWLDFSDDITEFTGTVKIRVQFGLQRRRITGRVSCEVGMDKNAVLLALNRLFDIVEDRTGRGVDRVVVKTFEANRDFLGIRLDGVKCYTRQGLFGVIERIYQKEEDTVRCENKITRHMTIDEFTALIHGGVSSYNLQQGLFVLSQRVEKLVHAVKFQNGLITRLLRLELARLERSSLGG